MLALRPVRRSKFGLAPMNRELAVRKLAVLTQGAELARKRYGAA